jgi:HAD superfamily hydrolase (TIGR01509 family)
VARHKPPHTPEELSARKRQRVVEIIRRDQPLFSGLPELIQKLAPKYRLALASGSERGVVEAVLELRDLRKYFSATVSSSEVKRGKPAPDIFLLAAKLLGVEPADCWVIEDSRQGVAGGLAAGMKVIAITNPYPADMLRQATQVVQSYGQIEQLLLG